MTVVGARIEMALRGVSCLPLEKCPPAKKLIGCTRSFPVAVNELDGLRKAVTVYTTRVAERLRQASLAANAMFLVETSSHAPGLRHAGATTIKMIYPTNSTQELPSKRSMR